MLRTALLDTGATISAFNPEIIQVLEPFQLGVVELARPGGTIQWVPTFDVRLAFEPDPQQSRWWQSGQWFNLEVVETAPALPGVDVLIGQDLLRKVVMSWDGPRDRSLLMY